MGQVTAVFGTHQENTLVQLQDVASRADLTALMADGHLGYVMPIGGVAAYKEKVSVVGVGFDIACGNAAIRTDRTLDDLSDHLGYLGQDFADEIQSAISFGVGRNNNADDAPVNHPLFESGAWSLISNRNERCMDIPKSRWRSNRWDYIIAHHIGKYYFCNPIFNCLSIHREYIYGEYRYQ